MPIDPKKKFDVFVSYAHTDNLPVGGKERGWVTEFVGDLRNRLAAAMGHRDFTIWHDASMRASEEFDASIQDAIANSAVFLVLLSPGWAASKYCALELALFNKLSGGPKVQQYSRIVGALRSHVPMEQWPEELRRQHEAPCFFDPAQPEIPLDISSPKFVTPLSPLLDAIKSVLTAMKKQREANTSVDQVRDSLPLVRADGTPTLYLGAATGLGKEREALVLDIQQLCQETNAQIQIEPSVPLPAEAGAAKAAILAALERSTMSLHLIGGEPDAKPAGWERALGILELETAVESPLACRHLVWTPKSVDIEAVDSRKHHELLVALRDTGRPPQMTSGSAVVFLQTDLEELKTELHRRLVPPKNPVQRRMDARSQRRPLIYVSLKGPGARGELEKLKSALVPGTYRICSLDHEALPNLDMHKANLKFCDGFAVFYDPATLEWAEVVMHEALLSSWSENRPRTLAAIELPPAPEREFSMSDDALVRIRWSGGPGQEIEKFLGALGDSDG